MPECEMCGRYGELAKVLVEKTTFSVCIGCKKFGKVLCEDIKPEVKKIIIRKQEIIDDIALNYSELIKNKREKLNLSQKELALKLNEKEGLISKIENGNIKPSLDLARKIGKYLGLSLVIEEKISEFGSKF